MDEGASSEEVKELKNQLKAAEIRKQRLIEAFKKTSSDFREVSYRLTGNFPYWIIIYFPAYFNFNCIIGHQKWTLFEIYLKVA